MTSNENSKKLSQERYTKFGERYVTSETHAKGADLDLLLDFGNPQTDWLALDIATGGGHTALKFAPSVKKVIATDITPKMIENAAAFINSKNIHNIFFEVADAEDLPYPNNHFDLVTCRIAPHHFPNCQKFVYESARVLKSGGALLVQDHVLPDNAETALMVDQFERMRDPSHHKAFSAGEWAAMFEVAKLDIQKITTFTKRHNFIDWATRQGHGEESLRQLEAYVNNAPDEVKDWLKPVNWGSDTASFVNHHIVLAGRKT